MISLRDKIAQMLIVGFSGRHLHDHHEIAETLQSSGLGGVILFDRDLNTGQEAKNIENQSQIKALIKQLKTYNKQSHNQYETLSLFVGIDYEGDAVDRLSNVEGCIRTMSAQMQANLSESQCMEEFASMAEQLVSLGFNLNFAPVVDLAIERQSGIMARLGRCFSEDPNLVSKTAKNFLKAFNDRGITCVYKHFPGHGSAEGDSHLGFVDTTTQFSPDELLPYKHYVASHQDAAMMIMTAHLVNRKLDPDGLPATLSYEMLTGLLRQEIGYEGVIVSDDMQMKAISAHFELEESLLLGLNAGIDMFIFCNQLDEVNTSSLISTIEQLVLSKRVSTERIDESYARIVRLKRKLL